MCIGSLEEFATADRRTKPYRRSTLPVMVAQGSNARLSGAARHSALSGPYGSRAVGSSGVRRVSCLSSTLFIRLHAFQMVNVKATSVARDAAGVPDDNRQVATVMRDLLRRRG